MSLVVKEFVSTYWPYEVMMPREITLTARSGYPPAVHAVFEYVPVFVLVEVYVEPERGLLPAAGM